MHAHTLTKSTTYFFNVFGVEHSSLLPSENPKSEIRNRVEVGFTSRQFLMENTSVMSPKFSYVQTHSERVRSLLSHWPKISSKFI